VSLTLRVGDVLVYGIYSYLSTGLVVVVVVVVAAAAVVVVVVFCFT
jgi:hypothetical protein